MSSVSTPISVEGPKRTPTLDALDTKMIQYHYSILKLQSLIKNIAQLQKSSVTGTLVFLPYLIALSGTIFGIYDQTTMKRIEGLSNFNFDKLAINVIARPSSHIPNDINDWAVIPVVKAPSSETVVDCLRALEAFSRNAIISYQRRLEVTKADKEMSTNGIQESYTESFNDILEPTEMELAQEMVIKLRGDEDYDYDFQLCSIETDLNVLSLANKQFQTLHNRFQPEISRYKTYKTVDQIRKLKDWKFILHRIAAIAIRLNDLYIVFRQIGRRAYMANYQRLHNSKYIFHSKLGDKFSKMIAMTDLFYNNAKKNGMLIATITRLTRKNSGYVVSPTAVLDLSHFDDQGLILMNQFLAISKEFQQQWTIAELRFRQASSQPRGSLLKLAQQDQQEAAAAAELAEKLALLEIRARPIPVKVQSRPRPSPVDASEAEKEQRLIYEASLRDKEDEFQPPSADLLTSRVSRSRSSSVSSNSSRTSIPGQNRTPSRTPQQTNLAPGVNRRASMISPSSNKVKPKVTVNGTPTSEQRNSVYISSMSPNGPTLSRRSSVIYQSPVKNSSSASLSAMNSPAHPSVLSPPQVPQNRRRANSQPVKLDSANKDGINAMIAASGAAVALTHKFEKDAKDRIQNLATAKKNAPQVQAPSQQVPRKQQATKIPEIVTTASDDATTVSTSSSEKSLSESASAPVKLSAAQRFQQHIKDGSKNGSFSVQTAPKFSTYTFDPNAPNLKRKAGPPPQSSEVERNTTLNSKTIQVSDSESSSISKPSNDITEVNNLSAISSYSTPNSSVNNLSKSSSTSDGEARTGPVKKRVRFTGVRAWTEAEDTPSTANRILKNFAVFNRSIPQTRKKEQKLKREEGSYFLKYNHEFAANSLPAGRIAMMNSMGNNGETTGTTPAYYSPPKPLSRLKNKIF